MTQKKSTPPMPPSQTKADPALYIPHRIETPLQDVRVLLQLFRFQSTYEPLGISQFDPCALRVCRTWPK